MESKKRKNKADQESHKNVLPKDSIKFVEVNIDSEILFLHKCETLIKDLQDKMIQANSINQIIPNTISWANKETSNMNLIEDEFKTVLLVKASKDFIKLMSDKLLHTHLQTVQDLFPNERPFLCIYGIENYFKDIRNAEKKNKNIDTPKVTRKQIEITLTEIQILLGINYKFTESPEELVSTIAEFTKSIAEAPYKKRKHMIEQEADCFIRGSNKDCVRVDNNGNGLQRLWQQQLIQFNLARLETAEAIVNNYPTPRSLMDAYDSCQTVTEAEQLLEGITIRRAAGPLTAARKIGPELSKKMYLFFTTLQGDIDIQSKE